MLRLRRKTRSEWFKKIAYFEQLSEGQKEIVDVIGIDAYIRLTKYFGGGMIYIGKYKTVAIPARNAEIQAKFDGSNYRQLAREYGLSEVMIRKIISKKK